MADADGSLISDTSDCRAMTATSTLFASEMTTGAFGKSTPSDVDAPVSGDELEPPPQPDTAISSDNTTIEALAFFTVSFPPLDSVIAK